MENENKISNSGPPRSGNLKILRWVSCSICLPDDGPARSVFPHSSRSRALVDSDSRLFVTLDTGADVNAQGGQFGNALQAPSILGYEWVAQLLLDNGADVDAQGGLVGMHWRWSHVMVMTG